MLSMRELQRERDLSLGNVTILINRAPGRPELTYVQESETKFRTDLLASGVPGTNAPTHQRTNTPTHQHSNTPTLQHSNTPTLQHSNTPTLQHSNTPTLQRSNTPTLQHSNKTTFNMDLQLKGKKAIVTGGSAGIGLAIARMLAQEGVQVTIPGRNIKKVNEAIATLSGYGRGIETDLGTAEGAKKLIAQVPETDILVNNLGIYESKDFTDITDEDWLHYFEVNLLGGIRLARHYFPAMLKRNSGRVIFVSSEAAAEVHPDMIHYGVTKTGQVVVARGLAEMTKGTRVTVNSVCRARLVPRPLWAFCKPRPPIRTRAPRSSRKSTSKTNARLRSFNEWRKTLRSLASLRI